MTQFSRTRTARNQAYLCCRMMFNKILFAFYQLFARVKFKPLKTAKNHRCDRSRLLHFSTEFVGRGHGASKSQKLLFARVVFPNFFFGAACKECILFQVVFQKRLARSFADLKSSQKAAKPSESCCKEVWTFQCPEAGGQKQTPPFQPCNSFFVIPHNKRALLDQFDLNPNLIVFARNPRTNDKRVLSHDGSQSRPRF